MGDPLYEPFRHLSGRGVKQDSDIEFRALRAAAQEWKDNPLERQKQLEKASDRMGSGVLAEAVGLDCLQRNEPAAAVQWFRTAKRLYVKTEDKLRQDFQIVAIDRAANRKDFAVRGLRDAKMTYAGFPEAEALDGWLKILDPPPPVNPPNSEKVPAVGKP